MTKKTVGFAASAVAALAIMLPGPVRAQGDVNIYSYRQEFLIRPLLEAFTKKSGIKTNVLFASKGLIQRIKAEGANSNAVTSMPRSARNTELRPSPSATDRAVSPGLNQSACAVMNGAGLLPKT